MLTDILDAIAKRLPADEFPTAGKLLLQTIQGANGEITERDFSPEELAALRRLVYLSGNKGYVNYSDYLKAFNDYRSRTGKMPMSTSPGLFSLGDPLGNLQTSLGRFRYEQTPTGIRVIDTYDFNPPDPNASKFNKFETGMISPFIPIWAIRQYAGEKIPPGKGRNVVINLPADMP